MFSIETGNFSIQLIYKKIRHIYFRVHHHSKKIIISAPDGIHPEALKKAVNTKKCWIEKQIKISHEIFSQGSQSFLEKEHFLFQGHAYSVKIHLASNRPKIIIGSDGSIHIYVKPGYTPDDLNHLIESWYRTQLKIILSELISKWEPQIGVRVREARVRKMKTRWGSCNVRAGRIWINLSLIRMDRKILEYVVVHEMVHLLEPSHNTNFKKLMSRFLPEWPDLDKQLDYTAVEPPSTLNV